MKVEVDVASVGNEDSVADVVQSLLFELLKFLEKARLQELSASCRRDGLRVSGGLTTWKTTAEPMRLKQLGLIKPDGRRWKLSAINTRSTQYDIVRDNAYL